MEYVKVGCYCVFFLILTSCSSLNWKPDTKSFIKESKVSDTELNFQYFGVSSLYINDGKTYILVDGFFTRQCIFKSLIHGIHSDPEQVEKIINQSKLNKIDALLISHAHYDHILDASALKSSKILGSNQAKKRFTNTSFIEVEDGYSQVFGKFKVTFFKTKHANKKWYVKFFEYLHLLIGGATSYYEPGDSYSFLLEHPKGTVLIIPSANYIPHQFDNIDVDIVFMGVGLLADNKKPKEYIKNYWLETVVKTNAEIVIPIHWDPFNKPISNPLSPTPYIFDDLKFTMDELKKLADESKVTIKLLPVIVNTTPLRIN